MNTYDTLKIAFPSHLLGVSDKERARSFDRRTVEGETLSSKHTLRPTIVKSIRGLSSLEITEEKGVLEVSAKSLGQDYFDGISTKTIERALGAVIPTFLTPNVAEIVDRSSVMRCDVVRNVPCENIPFTLAELGLYPVSPHTLHEPYMRGRLESVVWRSSRKTRTFRLIAYDKVKEASRKRDPTVWRGLGIDRFIGHIRVEANIRRHADIRDMHGIQEGRAPYLTDILHSRKNALGAVMDYFLPPDQEPTETHTNVGGQEGIKEEGYLSVFRRCQWNWDMIRAYVLAGYSERSNPTRVMREVRRLYDRHNPNGGERTVSEYRRVRQAIDRPSS